MIRIVVTTLVNVIPHGVVGNISACHADARGSIPRGEVFYIISCALNLGMRLYFPIRSRRVSDYETCARDRREISLEFRCYIERDRKNRESRDRDRGNRESRDRDRKSDCQPPLGIGTVGHRHRWVRHRWARSRSQI